MIKFCTPFFKYCIAAMVRAINLILVSSIFAYWEKSNLK